MGSTASTRRRCNARRACVALLTGLVAFALLELATAFLLESRGDPEYVDRLDRLQKRVRAAPEKPLTVVALGTSRTTHGLWTNRLDAPLSQEFGRPVVVGNFGFAGGGPLTELITWKRLRRDGVRPGLVLIEVLPVSLTRSWPIIEAFAPRLLDNGRLSRGDLEVLERHLGSKRPAMRTAWQLDWFNAIYSHRLTLLSRAAPGLVPFTFHPGPHPLPEDPSEKPRQFTPEQRQFGLEESRNAYGKYLADFELGGPCCRCLRELLACCKDEGVAAALLIMPEGPEFRSWYGPGAHEQVWGWLDCLSREFDVPILDAHCWLDEDAFIDSHHMLPGTAVQFTQRLGHEKLLPLLRDLTAHPRRTVPPTYVPAPFGAGEEAEAGDPY